MRVCVLVPTYRRPDDLRRLLGALRAQERAADEIIVTVRDTDAATREALDAGAAEGLPVTRVTVGRPGVVAALNCGLERATADIVCITDDDAAPRPDWLGRIERHFQADPSLAGLGGRDQIYDGGRRLDFTPRRIVGKLQWFGRVIGNHHLGSGAAREVDVLKGVNMSFRREAIAPIGFDQRMRGTGAQVHFELALCLTLRRSGGRLVYDPDLVVDHYPAQRHDEDQRRQFVADARENAVHNETLALLEHLPMSRRLAFILWSMAVGTASDPGLAQLPRLLMQRQMYIVARWRAAAAGRVAGYRTFVRSKDRPRLSDAAGEPASGRKEMLT